MIERLAALELSGFRCFSTPDNVPLDADIVLIHGSNGTGKTSLLSAIELALTGKVHELSVFESDYPRCLRNVTQNSDGYVRLKYLSEHDEEIVVKHDFGETTRGSNAELSSADINFFRDRCYLSQSSLSRLLETYQASTPDQPEQPLVRFVRELLGLDLLENITAGLYETEIITRLDKSVPALARVREDAKSLESKIQEIRAAQVLQISTWQQSLVKLQTLTAEMGDPIPGASWELEGVRARQELFSRTSEETAVSTNLRNLRHSEGRLHRALARLGVPSASIDRTQVQRQLDEILTEQAELERRIAPILDQAHTVLAAFNINIAESDDTAARFAELHAALKAARASLETRGQILGQTQIELTELRSRAATVDKELASIKDTKLASGSPEALARALADILEHVKGDECPVCGRDYAEVGGKLREHIVSEIQKLTENAKAFHEAAQRQESLGVESSRLAQRVIAVAAALKGEQERHASSLRQQADLDAVLSQTDQLADVWNDWRQRRSTLVTLRAQLRTAEAQEKERSEAVDEIRQVKIDVAPREQFPSNEPRSIANSLMQFTGNRAEALEKRASKIAGYKESLSAAFSAGVVLEKTNKELNIVLERLEKAQHALSHVKENVESAKQLSKAATRAKTRTLDQVFNEKLNGLWRDLFRRLVKHEPFQPRLRDPKTVRGQIRTSIGAWRDDFEPFEQFASVASSGNLNTAALSLFLSLHLIEHRRHGILILDDPIQNMDDLHVVQFANLMRQIQQKAKRQLLLAVHERALFEYLRLELGPSATHGSLLTLELDRRDADDQIRIKSAVYPWEPENVQFTGMSSGSGS